MLSGGCKRLPARPLCYIFTLRLHDVAPTARKHVSMSFASYAYSAVGAYHVPICINIRRGSSKTREDIYIYIYMI